MFVKEQTKLHVEFTVRELVKPDSGIEPKYITFGDDVEPDMIKEFFTRCGLAASIVFSDQTKSKLYITQKTCTTQKIDLIKAIRELTQVSLIEAKYIAELPTHSAMICFNNKNDAEYALEIFNSYGINNLVIESASDKGYEALLAAGAPEFKKPLP